MSPPFNCQNTGQTVKLSVELDIDLQGSLTGHVGQKLVFVPEQMSGSDDSRIRVHFLDTLFALGLGPQELGLGFMRRVQVRKMYKSRDTRIGSNLCDSFCAFRVHIVVAKVPVYIVSERVVMNSRKR